MLVDFSTRSRKIRFCPILIALCALVFFPLKSICQCDNEHDRAVQEISHLIPNSYVVFDSIVGDLNADEFQDVILLLRHSLEDSVDSDLERPLFLLLGSRNGFTKIASNCNVVYCRNCGGIMGDPYTGTQIDSTGTFTIRHYGGSNWRWTRNLTFQYDAHEKDWFLVFDLAETFNVFDNKNVEVVTRTPQEFGKVSFKTFDIHKE